MNCTIRQAASTKIIELSAPVLLCEALAGRGLPVDMPCGGRQQCLKCRVIARGELSPPSDRERALLSPEELDRGVRFACMATVLGDVTVELTADEGKEHILTQGVLPEFMPEPWAHGPGAAVDIGTTTLAAYLYRLEDGILLAANSTKNPQVSYGADVISRLDKALNGAAQGLAETVRTGLAELLKSLCDSAGFSVGDLNALTITGNTAMLYLLCGENPASIAAAPFQQDDSFGRMVSPDSLGLALRPDAAVYLTRVISAYVGGDITSAALAAGFAQPESSNRPHIELLCDIGTNGEMVLRCDDRLYGCSTAAGPAFEGAGLHCGMNARSGAIHRVTLEQGRIVSHVLDGGEAKGICGSGIVDALAVLLDAGVLDESGYLNEDGHGYEDCITEMDDSPAFRLPGTSVAITQQDVRTIQLAKSAICAGMTALLAKAGLEAGQVERFLIAGGFGSCIDVCSAERIGLILPGFAGKSAVLGNAAGTGACMTLLSRAMLEQSEHLAQRVETLELSTDPIFMDAYVEGMLFPS